MESLVGDGIDFDKEDIAKNLTLFLYRMIPMIKEESFVYTSSTSWSATQRA